MMHPTVSKYRAIIAALSLGQRLQEEVPELADDYRAGLSYTAIAAKHDICEVYSTTGHIAKRAVQYACQGNNNYYAEISPYTGLILPEEKKHLVDLHDSLKGKANASLKRGMFARTPEEVRRNLLLVANPASLQERGLTAWTDQEKNRVYLLWKDPLYTRQQRQSKGKPDLRLIAARLNYEFHNEKPVRNRASVDCMVRIQRRRLENLESLVTTSE